MEVESAKGKKKKQKHLEMFFFFKLLLIDLCLNWVLFSFWSPLPDTDIFYLAFYLPLLHWQPPNTHYSPWPASSSSAQMLSLGVDLLKCMLYTQVGSPGDSALLSNSTRGSLQSTQVPSPSLSLCLSLSPSLSLTHCCTLQMSTFVLNKESYCFC